MKILWITNAPFPEVSENMKLENVVKGWVYSSAYELIKRNASINLGVASIYGGKHFKQIEIGNIKHFLIPQKVRTKTISSQYDMYWIQIKKQFNPDIVHIHGSEYPVYYSYIRACGVHNVVVSIQGLVSVIERYYLGGICKKDLLKSITLRDLARNDTVFSQHKNLYNRGKYEKLLFQSVHHVIGRTSWDYNNIMEINPEINYHFCNETLRPSFYNTKWSLQNCEKFSIFISQANYPIKGFHQMLKALPMVIKHFPKTKVYVAGDYFFIKRGLRINGFGNYINSLINKYKLTDYIISTGLLSEEAICKRFLLSHLSVCPSIIENSSNSIGEAQLLGVPCIASYVGGTPDLIVHGKTGLLYRFEEFEMLAAYICNVFSDDKLALNISENCKISAAKRHNKQKNAEELYDIYSNILQ